MLKMVSFNITPVCGNTCEYCYMGDMRKNGHPPLYQIANIIKELSKQDIEDVLLVGGDPCTYPYLSDIIKLSYNLGLNIDIMSNTFDFQDRSILPLIRNFDTTIMGENAEIHDRVAHNNGAYGQLMKNIKQLTCKGYKVGFAVNLTNQTYDHTFKIVRNLIEIEDINPRDIKYIMIQRIIPKGNADGSMEYSLKETQINTFFKSIDLIKELYHIPIIVEDTFPLCVVEKKYHQYLENCKWGFTKGAVSWNGDVFRCGANPTSKLGNIFEQNLKDLWEKSSTLLSFRGNDWLPPGCKMCSFVEKCRCGCPASSITLEDHAPDVLYIFKNDIEKRIFVEIKK